MPITKKRLQSYIGLRLENENINERIARMQSAAEMPPMSSGDGSQHTSSSGDRMARAVERLIEYKSQVAPTLESNRQEMLEIEQAVNALPDPLEREVLDGASGQQLLAGAMKQAKLKAPVLPTVKQVVVANAAFEQGLFSKTICHMGQPALTQAVSNCEKRAIGSNGGFGYRAILEGVKIELMDSMVLAYWACHESKEKRKQRISY